MRGAGSARTELRSLPSRNLSRLLVGMLREPPPPHKGAQSNCTVLITISKRDVVREPLRAWHRQICNPKCETSPKTDEQGKQRQLSGCTGAGAEHFSVGQTFSYIKQTQRIIAVNISPHRNHLNFQLTKTLENRVSPH